MPSLATILRSFLPPRLTGHDRAERSPIIPVQKFEPVGVRDFLALDIPPRDMLLAPILPERSLAMLYAPRGIGKSWLGLSIGVAVASGDMFLRWNAPRPRRVLVCDGEMPLADLQSRLRSILTGFGTEIPNDGFRILAADQTEGGINLGSVQGQQALEQHLEGVDLLILDNLSTLLANGSEGSSDSWLPLQNWLLRLRRKGVAVLIIHHAGVNGRQRGTSRREDALDTVIALRRPADYSPEQGARFEVHIEKARTLAGEAALPFEACLEHFFEELHQPAIRWIARDIKPPLLDQAAELFAEGSSVREVAARLGISRSEAGRLRLRAVEEGLFASGAEEESEAEDVAPGSPPRLN